MNEVRRIKVPKGSTLYEIVSDDGRKVGRIIISLSESKCMLALNRLYDIEELGIDVRH